MCIVKTASHKQQSMNQAKPIKFQHMVSLPDVTSNGQGGFSNRFNMDMEELKTAGNKFKSKQMRWTATRKVDGVSSMVVAFVMPMNDATTQALRDCPKITWQWDYEARRMEAGTRQDMARAEWIDILSADPDARARFYQNATRAFLLPRTIWSQRYVPNDQYYYINVSVYAPNGKCLQMPHYMRAPVEDYCIQYYRNLIKREAGQPWIREVVNGKPKVLAFRTEIIMGKAEPVDASTFIDKLRKLNCAKGNDMISSWKSIIYHTAVSTFPEKRKKLAEEQITKQLNADELDADELMKKIKQQSEELLSGTDAGKYFFLLNYFYEAQWNPSTVIEEDPKKTMNLHQHQLGLVVLDDYTSCIRTQWLKTITCTPSAPRANGVPLPSVDAFVIVPEGRDIPNFYERIIWLHQSQQTGNAFTDPDLWSPMRRPNRLMHTVDIVMQADWKDSPDLRISQQSEELQQKLNLHVSLENGEGFMLVIETRDQGLSCTNVFKFKQFMWIPVFPIAFTTAFGYFNEQRDSGIVRNQYTEPSEEENLFLDLIARVNGNHFYTVNNVKVWPRKQNNRNLPEGVWLKRPKAKDAYEPITLTMLPWGVYKNVNGLALTATLGTRDLVSLYASQDRAPPVSKFLLWVQYVRSCRARLMCTPCTSEDDMTPRMRRQLDQQTDIKTYHEMNKNEQMKTMLLQLVGIQLFAEMWRQRVVSLQFHIEQAEQAAEQAAKRKLEAELKRMFVFSGSLVKQLVFNRNRFKDAQNEIANIEKGRLDPHPIPISISRLTLRLYQIQKLLARLKAGDTKEWYGKYKGVPGLDGFDIDNLQNWKLHTTKSKSQYKYDMPKQIQKFRTFMHKYEGHLENESAILKRKLAYDLKQAKFEHVFTPQKALDKIMAIVKESESSYNSYHPYETTSMLAQQFVMKFVADGKFNHYNKPTDREQYKNRVKTFLTRNEPFKKLCEQCAELESIETAMCGMLEAAYQFRDSEISITDLDQIQNKFHINSLPMSMLVNQDIALPPDDVSEYARSSLKEYWDDFEGYFEYNAIPYYQYSKICTETVTRMWLNDTTAAQCLTLVFWQYQNKIRQADIGDEDDEGDGGDAHKNDIQPEISTIQDRFASEQDEHPFLDSTEKLNDSTGVHEDTFAMNAKFLQMIVEKIAFDNGYQWPLAQPHEQEEDEAPTALFVADSGQDDSNEKTFGLNDINLNGDNFDGEIEMHGDVSIEKLLEPGDQDRSARAAVLMVVDARHTVEPGADKDASLSLDELLAWRLKQQVDHDDTSDVTSVAPDEENETDYEEILIGIGYHRIQFNNIGDRKKQWLEILEFLHSKSQQHATHLRTVVEKHLYQHQILAEAWVAMGKQPA